MWWFQQHGDGKLSGGDPASDVGDIQDGCENELSAAQTPSHPPAMKGHM